MVYDLFAFIGIRGEHLPMLILIVVLLMWHVVKKDRWRFEPRVYGWMWFESIIYALPLFVFAIVDARFRAQGMAAEVAYPLQGSDIYSYTLPGQLVFAVGAGLYEELVFRLLGLTLLHMVLVDFLDINDQWGTLIAVIVTTVAFALYHFIGGRPITFSAMVFYILCGGYLAGLFIYRGFGIAVATHAIYDIMVVLRNDVM
jgi:membrane protease YdiL (CAAX protease family)